jgi:hypothetical protein
LEIVPRKPAWTVTGFRYTFDVDPALWSIPAASASATTRQESLKWLARPPSAIKSATERHLTPEEFALFASLNTPKGTRLNEVGVSILERGGARIEQLVKGNKALAGNHCGREYDYLQGE